MFFCGSILAAAQISNFQHIVIIFQENRSPDNLFQGLCGTNHALCPSPYDVRGYGLDSAGTKVYLTKIPLGSLYDPNHAHAGFVKMCDLDTATNQCKMDGLTSIGCKSGKCSFAYVDPSDVAPYITMAQQYGWANFMFQTNQGPSTPAHQFIFGGTSAPSAADDAAATFITELGPLYGCLTPVHTVYAMISPATAPIEYSATNYPLGSTCFTRDTMATLLDGQNLRWKYYTPGAVNFWTAPDWIQPICQPNADYTECEGPEFLDSVDTNPPDVLTDAANCNLRDMVWVIPSAHYSDHPGHDHPNTGGPSWVSSIVNAIGQSPCVDIVNGRTLTYWQDTAIFVTWDDWGGWYDHEPPTLLSTPQQGQGDYQYGFRVPLLVVSAYTPAGFVSNRRNDFGSILRFAEQNFGIPEGALNFADARAANDLTEFFQLDQSPRTFQVIPAPLDAQFFLHDKRPLEAPDTE
jgi:phospholipase C